VLDTCIVGSAVHLIAAYPQWLLKVAERNRMEPQVIVVSVNVPGTSSENSDGRS
jgi:hypothetical protein